MTAKCKANPPTKTAVKIKDNYDGGQGLRK